MGGGGAHWVVYGGQEGVDFIIKTSWLNFVSLTLSLHNVIICKTKMYLLHNWPFFWPQNDLMWPKMAYNELSKPIQNQNFNFIG